MKNRLTAIRSRRLNDASAPQAEMYAASPACAIGCLGYRFHIEAYASRRAFFRRVSLSVAIRITWTGLPITSAGRRSPLGPLGIWLAPSRVLAKLVEI
jgi:hypothetical protein